MNRKQLMAKLKERKVTFRVTEDEYNFLLTKSNNSSEKFKNGKENVSGFIRETLLSETGYRNVFLERQLKDLRYEIRKIGTNINQVVKKINSGYGTQADVPILEKSLEEIKESIDEYERLIKEKWQSPN